jgi:hypothetical protein
LPPSVKQLCIVVPRQVLGFQAKILRSHAKAADFPGLMAEPPLAHIFDERFLMSVGLRTAPQFAVSPQQTGSLEKKLGGVR